MISVMHVMLLKELLLLREIIKKPRKNRSLALKDIAAFISCISKINNVLINNAEDLDIVMLMCNLIEYRKTGRL